MITIHPYDANQRPEQCLPNTATSVRSFGKAMLSWNWIPPSEGYLASCEQRLSEAEAALHQVRLGKAIRYVHHDGRTVHYTPANVGELSRYVMQLRMECGTSATACACGICGTCLLTRGRAMSVVTY